MASANDNRVSPGAPGRRFHVVGYCDTAVRLKANVKRVLEPYQTIQPHDSLKWQWIDGLCPVCRSMGGVLLFNRAIEHHRQIAARSEPAAQLNARVLRRKRWFASEFHRTALWEIEAGEQLEAAEELLERAKALPEETEGAQKNVDKHRERHEHAVLAALRAKAEYEQEFGT